MHALHEEEEEAETEKGEEAGGSRREIKVAEAKPTKVRGKSVARLGQVDPINAELKLKVFSR